MEKSFEILGVDTDRGVMLIRFSDTVRQVNHETEVPVMPDAPDPLEDAVLAAWIKDFWPHSQMEVGVVGARVAAKTGLIMDITADVPAPDVATGRTRLPEPEPV